MRSSKALCRTKLFDANTSSSNPTKQAELSYLRAMAIGSLHHLEKDDVLSLTPKFWKMHTDPIVCRDTAASTLLTIQYNLAAGTLAKYEVERPDYSDLLNRILRYKTIAQFCLTEVGHGLGVYHMETTATLLKDGRYDLHTPSPSAAKFMPPTIPVLGIPCVAIVFARLIVDGEFRGIRPFLVDINDGYSMRHGVSAKKMPHRGGCSPVNHSATFFDHVTLAPAALLGDIEKSQFPHQDFLFSIWRVAVGAMAIGSTAIPLLQLSSHIAFRYSLRRHITSPDGIRIPIMSFRTQQSPILTAVAQSYVLRAFHNDAIKIIVDDDVDPRVKNGLASCVKAIMVQHCQQSMLALSDRCGAQGLFSYNQMSDYHSAMRGISIAEGDILVVSIRLATELLLGRYSMPVAVDPTSLLSRHEIGLLHECKAILRENGGHRSPIYASHVLPRCQAIVEAIGHRMAYEAAVAAGVPQCLIDLYVYDVLKLDLGWYIEQGLVNRTTLVNLENVADNMAQLHIADWVDEMDVAEYVTAPIVSNFRWDLFFDGLEHYEANSFQTDAKL